MAIYDCFTFYNEFELLELRLELLYPVVDHFVICECNKTLRGDDKPFYFAENKERFTKYLDKIINIQLTDPPMISQQRVKSNGNVFAGDWDIEHYQRNGIIRGLVDCKPEDIIMISDLDEIPDPDIVAHILDCKVSFLSAATLGVRGYLRMLSFTRVFAQDKVIVRQILRHRELQVRDLLDNRVPVALELDMRYYFLNCTAGYHWRRSSLTYYKNMMMPQMMRDIGFQGGYVARAGWHLSYMGGLARIKKKMQSIVEGNDKIERDDAYIEQCLSEGKDLFGRKGPMFTYHFLQRDEISIPHADEFIERYPYLYREPEEEVD